MLIVDSHCHLDYDVFDEDRTEMLKRAADHGVGYMLTISVSPDKPDAALKIAENTPNIFASVGVHPHEADKTGDDLYEQLITRANLAKTVGIGETGLDYYYGKSSREKQIQSFQTHLRVCAETGLPAIIHTRDADDDTVEILRTALAEKTFPVLIHCFTASDKMAEKCLDLGAYLSFSGIITFKKSQELRDTMQKVPLERILIETDSPYLAPEPHRGKRNEPSFVRHVAQKAAEVKGVSLEEICNVTSENFFRLFQKADQYRKSREVAQ